MSCQKIMKKQKTKQAPRGFMQDDKNLAGLEQYVQGICTDVLHKECYFFLLIHGKIIEGNLGACCQFIAYKSPVVNLVYNSVISCHMARFSKCSFSYWELDNLNATEYQYQSFTALCQSSLRIC